MPESFIIIAGLGLMAFLAARGEPLQTAFMVTVATVAALVVLVVSPREILEIVKLLREIRRLGLEGPRGD